MSNTPEKFALVTGGAKRIGAAIVRALAERNYAVYIHCNRSVSEAEALLATLPNRSWHKISCCDFSDPAARQAWLATLPHFDLVINNASCYRLTAKGRREKPADRQRYWQVNYHTALEIIAHQQKLLPENTCANAITLLDCDVLTAEHGVKAFSAPLPGRDSYLATRIALAHKLLELARSSAPALRIAAVAPGPVLPPVDCPTPGMTRILDKVPMHQAVKVEEIVNTILYLADNPSLTGTIIPVDGGMHLGVKIPRKKLCFSPAVWRYELSGAMLLIGAVFFVLSGSIRWSAAGAIFMLAALAIGNIRQKILAAVLLAAAAVYISMRGFI